LFDEKKDPLNEYFKRIKQNVKHEI